jgi:dTDP-4-dehydrorhamnose 3,5-epimerase
MSGRFSITATSIEGLKVLQRKPLGDARGYLERIYCSDDLRELIGSRNILQINRTKTQLQGTVRGMHYQRAPHAEMKFVTCLRGRVFDVAVDLRGGSPTFLKWHAELLTDDNHRTLAIPEGFAHGLQTLTDDCELLYLHTAMYAAEAEGGVHPQDPALAIDWPQPVAGLSDRDRTRAMLTTDFHGLPT